MPDLRSLPRNGYGGIQKVLKSIKDPARLQWHEVKKVHHYWLKIDALTEPMKVCEEYIPYGDDEK